VSGDSVATVGLLGVFLGLAFGDLETLVRNNDIGAVGATADLLAITAMAERLIVLAGYIQRQASNIQ